MIYWIIGILAAIGAFVVSFVVLMLLGELVRSIRQSHRVATVHIRVQLAERRRPTWREWWFCFVREFDRQYDYLTIGYVNIPHDPSEPLRARYHKR